VENLKFNIKFVDNYRKHRKLLKLISLRTIVFRNLLNQSWT